jgi:hypothetical protein
MCDVVRGGGNLLGSYFSDIVKVNDTVPAGASLAALRDVLDWKSTSSCRSAETRPSR